MHAHTVTHFDKDNNIITRYVNCPGYWRDSVKPYLEESYSSSYINEIDFEYLIRKKNDHSSIKRFPFRKEQLHPLFVFIPLTEKYERDVQFNDKNFYNKMLNLMRQRVFSGGHKETMDTLYINGLYRKPVY
jgi:hypothetical protein